MLWRYLPEADDAPGSGWSSERHAEAQEFVQQLLDVHNAPPTIHWPHRHLIRLASLRLRDRDLQLALQAGCTFDPGRELPLDAEPTPPTRIADYVPRKPEPEPAAGGGGDRVASAPLPLGETRREPTADPAPPPPPPQAPMAPASTAARDARREPVVPSVPPAAATSSPEVAAAYSGLGDLYTMTTPPGDTAPGPWADTPPDPAPAGDEASNEPAPVRIRPRRRQTAIAAAATGALGVAAVAALWLSIGRSLDPTTTVHIPLPSASEVALPRQAAAPTTGSGASTPVVVAAMPQGAPPARPSEEAALPSSTAPPARGTALPSEAAATPAPSTATPPAPGVVTPGATTTPAPVTGESSSIPVERGVPRATSSTRSPPTS
jgi:hypothetical protein